MKLLRIVLKDVRARKRRILFAALGVVIGTMTITAILTISLAARAQVYSQLEKFGPNLTIVPAINNVDMKLGNVNLGQLSVGDNYISESRLPEIRKIADGEIKKALDIDDDGDIATIAPKLYVNTQIKGTPLTVVGMQAVNEMAIRTWWMVKRGVYIEDGHPEEAMVGSVAADVLKVNPGDKIDLNGRELTVTGILGETGSNDDYQVFTDLETVQSVFNKQDMLSVVDVRALCNACPVDVIAGAVNGQISGVRAVAVKQIAESEMGMIDKVNRFMLTLGAITLLIGLFGVVNTMMASVNERIKDIGIMRAVGASRGQIIQTFIYEAILIGIIGGIFGYLAGSGLAYLVGPMLFEGATISYVPVYFPLSVGLAILVAVVAAVWPAQRASNIKVADCFRSL